ncbi:MAG: hypothetical protein IPO53_14925 [Chitinophagaceae bacterium]|nr:hypothetical protein [Chitinophagaceae bacterium]
MDNSTPTMSEKLVQYLDGALTGSEKSSLEKQLLAEETLQQELDRLKSTREALKLYGLQQKVSGIHVQMMEEFSPAVRKMNPLAKGSVKKMVRYSIAVAASLLLIIGGYMAYNFFTLSPDKVFASRYQSYELVTVRNGNTIETPVEKAFREKNFQEVFRIHDAREDLTPKGEFLCGAAALESANNTKAITCFKEVLEANKKSGQPLFNDEAEYYLSLSYIRNKDYDYALEMLNKIQDDPNHLYNEKISHKLIRQVKMLKWR